MKQEFMSKSLAWREGFIYSMADNGDYAETIQYVEIKDQAEFNAGWDFAEMLKYLHTKELNRG